MNVILTLNAGLGVDLGPNFTLTANVGVVSPNTATKSELLAGKSLVINNAATNVRATSVGTCTNYIIVNLGTFLCDYNGGTAVVSACDSAIYSIQNIGTTTILWEGLNCDNELVNGYVQQGNTSNTTCVQIGTVTVDQPENAIITFVDFC
jgi:hypothetical protein